jgi:hypothetical protein
MHTFWFAVMAGLLATQPADAPALRELFADSGFANGFWLSSANHLTTPGPLGVLQTHKEPTAAPPAWRLCQWATRYPLPPGTCRPTAHGGWESENAGKRLLFQGTSDGKGSLLLELRGIAEYGGHLRTAGEAWPHLLIEHKFDAPIRLNDVKRIPLTLESRIVYCRPDPAAAKSLNPNLHSAQVSMFWTVHNMTVGNPDYRDMIWFGIPIFDARHDVPPAYYAIDSGKEDATGKFICLLDGKRFWTGRTADGRWRTLDADLAVLLRDGLAIAKQHGALKNTRFEDLAITTFNFGWEITGPYDAAIEFRNLSIKSQ